MNPTLSNFLKLTTGKMPHLMIIGANEDYQSIVNFCVGKIKRDDGRFNSIKWDIDKNFDYKQAIASLQNVSLFDLANFIEINYKTKPLVLDQKHLPDIYQYHKLNPQDIIIITTNFLNKKDISAKWVQEFLNYGVLMVIGEYDISSFINYFIQSHKFTIEQDAIGLLIKQNQSNISMLMQELQSLVLYFGNQSAPYKITTQDILHTTTSNSNYDIYKLSNAYLSGDIPHALSILDNVYTSKDDAILISWMIHEDIKKLILAKAKYKTNKNLHQISKELGIWGERVEIFIHAFHHLDYKKLLEMLDMIASLDFVIKGVILTNPKDKIIDIILSFNSH